jgi:hypothetical protein
VSNPNNTAARDLLSNADIAATCGDADCATSDAEMTFADLAAFAGAEQDALETKRAEQRAAWLAGAPAREEAARVALASKVTAGTVVCPCCSRIVKVRLVRADGTLIVGKHGWKGQNNGRNYGAIGGRGLSGVNTAPCEGTYNGVLAA